MHCQKKSNLSGLFRICHQFVLHESGSTGTSTIRLCVKWRNESDIYAKTIYLLVQNPKLQNSDLEQEDHFWYARGKFPFKWAIILLQSKGDHNNDVHPLKTSVFCGQIRKSLIFPVVAFWYTSLWMRRAGNHYSNNYHAIIKPKK